MKGEIRKRAGGTARYVARWMGMWRPWCRTGTWLAGGPKFQMGQMGDGGDREQNVWRS